MIAKVRTFLALAFIAGVAAVALYCARRPTIAQGSVMAADLLEQFQARGWRKLTCDDRIPIQIDGAKFHCRLEVADGDRALLAVKIDRDGRLFIDVIDTSAPEHRHVPAKADPWD